MSIRSSKRFTLALRILLIFMLAVTFLGTAGQKPASAQGGGNPIIEYSNNGGYINTWGWSPNINVTLTIAHSDSNGIPYYTEEQTSDPFGNVYFQGALAYFGDIFIVTDGTSTKTLVIDSDLSWNEIHYSSGNVSGYGTPGDEVLVELFTESSHDSNTTIVDGNGGWETNISLPMEFGSNLRVSIIDDDGDALFITFEVAPFMVARMNVNQVMCHGWEPGTWLTLQIDDLSNGEGIDYERGREVTYDQNHFTLSVPRFNLNDYLLQPGMLLTLSDGYFTRKMTVAPITLDVIDPANDLLSGTSVSNADIYVEVDQLPEGIPSQVKWVTSDADGNWSADFSGSFDINDLTEGAVRYFPYYQQPYPTYESNDHTRIEFQVVPDLIANTVSVSDGGEVALDDGSAAIEVPPGALSEDTVMTIAPNGTDFQVTTDLGVTQPAVNVDIGPNGTQFETPVSITLTWPDEDLDGFVDDTSLNEADLYVFKDGVMIAGPCSTDPDRCSRDNNTYTVQVSSLSQFVLGVVVGPALAIDEISGPLAPVKVNTPTQISGILSAAGEYTVDFDWGDSAVSSVSTSGANFSDLHAYSTPGVYTIGVSVKDGDAVIATAIYEFVVVYDPTAGFVTGGGWISSPAGAYQADPALTGKATFGFVSRYKKGASVPDGNTEFQFKAGGLNFHSESYEWLVVNKADSRAQYKGVGTINGALAPNGAAYKFMIWAKDGSPDTFRIKIWWEDAAGEQVVYDNGVEQAIGGGSIVVHK